MNHMNRNDFIEKFGNGLFDGVRSDLLGVEEITPLVAMSRHIKPKTVIEIGLQRGNTAKCILENSPWIEKYIGIDIFPDGITTLEIQRNEVPQVAGEFAKNDPRLEVVLKKNGSMDLKVDDLPRADYIFIDGDHSYQGVAYDSQLALGLIRDGGVVIWHDYNNPPVPDVTRLIDELNYDDSIFHLEGTMLCFKLT